MSRSARTAPPQQPDGTVAPAVDASTVALLRGTHRDPDGLEVVLMRRHERSPAFAGAYVFPGGKVDPGDRELDPACWTVSDLPSQRARLEVTSDEDALAFLVAGLRETFEEAGVLLASRRDGTPLTAADLRTRSFVVARERLVSRTHDWSWANWLRANGLVLDLDALVFWSRWVTPPDRRHRFDTRFFLAALPSGQQVTHGEVEMTEARWVTPPRALEEHDAGLLHLRPATEATLKSLATHESVQQALAAGHGG